ncbi:hypothetical protein [Aureivirga marina]|uniref:hypothetical protein n=1 Tax=Aureivirga marina TaxID=1182451 RepID=UPI0018CA270A|nr:hypothetical protein [Aureivirga marina]
MMRGIITIFLAFISVISYSQNAITTDGKQVFLKSDGTWEYVNNSSNGINYTNLNDEEFYVAEDATFLVKSIKNPELGFYINPKIWAFEINDNPDQISEYIWKTKINNTDVFGTFLATEDGLSLEELKKNVLEEIRVVDNEAEVVIEEHRVVNGNKVLYMKVNGDLMDIHFAVYVYLFSNGKDNFIAEIHTSKNFNDYKATDKIIDMLNNVTYVNYKN